MRPLTRLRGGSLPSADLLLPAGFITLLILLAVLAPWISPADPLAQTGNRLLAPGEAGHLLGTDQFGRDILSRLLHGARADLFISIGATALATVLGTVLGLVGGYFRGFFAGLTMRSIEVVLAFPPIVLALLVVTLFGPGAATLVLAMGVLFAPAFARITYGQVLSMRNREFVQASRVLGASDSRLIFRVVLPNVLGPIFVQVSLTLAAALLLESGLSYLGLGVVPPTPSWGGMVAEAQPLGTVQPSFLIITCSVLVLTVLAFSLLGDAFNKHLDPRRSSRVDVSAKSVGV
jgi:peptide/nickel transport system permease protein